jgi:Ca2+-binding RTX toxin-like protein
MADERYSEGAEDIQFSILDYRIQNPNNKFYKDESSILTQGADVHETIWIQDKLPPDAPVSAGGGVEGYHQTAQFSPGMNVNLVFTPYTIPDEIIITAVSTGHVLVNSGFVGNGSVYSTVFSIPLDSTGEVQIDVNTNNPSTAWDFIMTPLFANQASLMGLVSAGMLAVSTPVFAEQAFAGEVINAVPAVQTAAVTTPFVFSHKGTVQIDEFEPSPDGSEASNEALWVSADCYDLSLAGKRLEAHVIPTGAHPVNAADFDPRFLFVDSFTVPADLKLGQGIYITELYPAMFDGIDEGVETFQVQIYDPVAKKYLTDSAGKIVALPYEVHEPFEFLPQDDLEGTQGNDILIAEYDFGYLKGGVGNDVLVAKIGMHDLNAGAGNDSVFAGSGDDSIDPGYGDDVVDGGAGTDTVYIQDMAVDISITKNADGSVTVKDTDAISFGTDRLYNVEVLAFSDKSVTINSTPTQNIAPMTVKDVASVKETASLMVNVLANDTDVNVADTLTIGAVTVKSVTGITGLSVTDAGYAFSIKDNQVLVQPATVFSALAAGAVATVELEYTAKDNAGAITVGNLTVTVTGEGAQVSVKVIDGTPNADSITGSSAVEHIFSHSGNDTVMAAGGNDTILGGQGNDSLDAGTGNDVVSGGTENDKLLGRDGNDTLNGNTGNDTVYGGTGADVMTGDAGDDRLYGEAGNDTMTGGSGIDRFYFVAGSGTDVVTDFDAEDRVYLTALMNGTTLDLPAEVLARLSSVGADTVLDLGAGNSITFLGIHADEFTSSAFIFA